MALKYESKYCRMLIEHFSNMRRNEKNEIIGLPSLFSFAQEIGKELSQVLEWKEKQRTFANACKYAEEKARRLLIDYALCGKVSVTFAKFMLSDEGLMNGANRINCAEREDEGITEMPLTEADRRLLEIAVERMTKSRNED